ncbi:MAG: aspartate/glutamate racemase family protein [Robiginitalea sp.]|jgi:aspartate racemase
MKKIGLIGGMSWESSLVYYRLLNEKVRELKGGFHSARCILESVDFAEIETLQHRNDWDSLNVLMGDAASNLEKAGAAIILLCTNTMHLCEPAIRAATSIPFLHIATATGKKIDEQGLKTVGLLGTRFTMEKDFYKKVLSEQYGIKTLIPEEEDRREVHRIIYQELVHGKIRDASREIFTKVIRALQQGGAEGVILGCTEIPLLISREDVDLPVFDTTRIHAEQAVNWALG